MTEPYVLGEIKLPPLRRIGIIVAYPLMCIGLPGAARWWFRCLLGSGVKFEVKDVQCPDSE